MGFIAARPVSVDKPILTPWSLSELVGKETSNNIKRLLGTEDSWPVYIWIGPVGKIVCPFCKSSNSAHYNISNHAAQVIFPAPYPRVKLLYITTIKTCRSKTGYILCGEGVELEIIASLLNSVPILGQTTEDISE